MSVLLVLMVADFIALAAYLGGPPRRGYWGLQGTSRAAVLSPVPIWYPTRYNGMTEYGLRWYQFFCITLRFNHIEASKAAVHVSAVTLLVIPLVIGWYVGGCLTGLASLYMANCFLNAMAILSRGTFFKKVIALLGIRGPWDDELHAAESRRRTLVQNAESMRRSQEFAASPEGKHREEEAFLLLRRLTDNDNDWYSYVGELAEVGGPKAVSFFVSYLSRLGGRNVNGIWAAISAVTFILARSGPQGIKELESFVSDSASKHREAHSGIVERLEGEAQTNILVARSIVNGEVDLGSPEVRAHLTPARAHRASLWGALVLGAVLGAANWCVIAHVP